MNKDKKEDKKKHNITSMPSGDTKESKSKQEEGATANGKEGGRGEEGGEGEEEEDSGITVYQTAYCKCPSSKSVEDQLSDKTFCAQSLFHHLCHDSEGNYRHRGLVEFTELDGRREVLKIVF